MMNRAAFKNRQAVKRIIAEAAEQARQPGDATHGTPTSSPGGTASISPALTGDFTYPDPVTGKTIRPFMLDVDALDDPTARLA